MNQEYPDPDVAVESLSPGELARRLDADERVSLLDVRNRDEIAAWRIEAPNRTDVPYMKFVAAEATDSVDDLVSGLDGPVVVVRGRGEASAHVAGLLEQEGIDAVNLDGGMEGWARFYESHTVRENPLVLQYDRPSSGCLAYLVVSDGEAAVIDPLRAFVNRYLDDAAEHGAELVAAVDTHVHADHVSGLRPLAEHTVEPYLPERATQRGYEGHVRTISDSETLTVGSIAIEAVAAPGHTTGMTAFRIDDLLLTGDGLFTRAVPRPDLEEGSEGAPNAARELYRTLTERFARFDDETLIAPGHYDTGRGESGPHVDSLGDIRERLSVFGTSEEQFVEDVLSDVGPRPANAERIVEINLGHETVSTDDAFELELGPNNCAARTTVD